MIQALLSSANVLAYLLRQFFSVSGIMANGNECSANTNLENKMSKKPAKATLTTATIEEQTAAFLKSGGSIEYVVKGKSGQYASTGSKQINLSS